MIENDKKIFDGQVLYKGIVAGINNLILYKDKLDEINVFPVPDGDTGTNMCFTLLPIVECAKEKITNNIEDVFNLIADTALESARGNSGTIIAQFFHGMRKKSQNKGTMNIDDFAIALQSGYSSAIDSLLKPQEGTIITVMRDVAIKALELRKQENIIWKKFLYECYIEAERSLQNTKKTLKILQKTNVVDAGALGYVLLIQGILNSTQRSSQIQSTHLNISYEHEKIDALKEGVDYQIKNRFCTECAIEQPNINRNEFKEMIKNLGDSMVFAGTKDRVKIHIHTNDPGKFFQICTAYGKIVDKKVDDMTKQGHTIHHMSTGDIAIVVDSGADIPKEYVDEIQIVPVRYSFGRNQHIDGVTQTSNEFYNQMQYDSNHPKTSQPTLGDFKKTYNFISSYYSSIVSIHLSEKVSGTLQSAINGSKSIKSTAINIIDSQSASVGLGLLAMYAVDLKQNGKSLKQIIDKVNKKKLQTEVYLVLDDLSYIVKGGRLPNKIKTIANLLRLIPILGVKKGKIKARGVLYGKSKIVEKFGNYLIKKIKPHKQYRLMIAHANANQKGEQLLKLLLTHESIHDSHLLELGCALGAHAGPGALAVGFHELD